MLDVFRPGIKGDRSPPGMGKFSHPRFMVELEFKLSPS
jgi:hypothetical protein